MVKVLVSGSLAFDVLFDIHGLFQDAIPHLEHFNASYTAQSKKQYEGGTAGNIAFWLTQAQVKPTVFSAWGKDFNDHYRPRLEKLGVDLRGYEGEYTAHAYIASDQQEQQLSIWQPNAYERFSELHLADYFTIKELQQVQIAIFSAGTPHSITKQMYELRQVNPTAMIIFDPGQVTTYFSKSDFETCLQNADIIIGNEVESALFREKAALPGVHQIETQGARGATLITKTSEQVQVPAVPAEKVVNTTGAGDAFRAGVMAQLLLAQNWRQALERGVELGSQAVGFAGGQMN